MKLRYLLRQYLIVSLNVLAFMLGNTSLANATSLGDAVNWCCVHLKIDCAIWQKAGGNRGNLERDAFEQVRLVQFDLDAQTETLLWQSESMWSPAIFDQDHIAVLKRDGLYLVPLDLAQPRPTQPALAAPGLKLILGHEQGATGRLIVARRVVTSNPNPTDADPEAHFSLSIADLTTGLLETPPELSAIILDQRALAQLTRADSLRGNLQLAAEVYASPRKILVGKIDPAADTDPSYDTLMDDFDALDRRSRFDPIWLSDRQIIYVAEP